MALILAMLAIPAAIEASAADTASPGPTTGILTIDL